jgi:extracellular factor (EF) 3-hydroxypalmitic acid methyl ester biosynthesis protein
MTNILTPPTPWTDDRLALLNRAYDELSSDGDLTAAMDRLSNALWWFRLQDQQLQWQSWVEQAALRHPVCGLVHCDPFTHRSFTKPRGFAGDSELIDLIYFDQGWANLSSHSDLGRRIFWRNRNAPAPRAVRERRDHCALIIDRVAVRKHRPRVLVVACGNLREALTSVAVQTGSVGELVAFDQDQAALNCVARALGSRATCRRGSVRTIVGGGLDSERFDLIYAAGLYDYLERRLASKLTAKLFSHLDSDGELVVANFTNDVADIGYMESYMAWNLIFRSLDELLDLAADIPFSARSAAEVYQLQCPDIAYLRLINSA